MTPDEIKTAIRDAINSMVKGDTAPEAQETANDLFRQVIQTKSAAIVNPPEVDLTTPTDEEAEAAAAAALAAADQSTATPPAAE